MEPSELSATSNHVARDARCSHPKRNARTSRLGRTCWGKKPLVRRTSKDIRSYTNSDPDPALLQKAQADFAAAALEFAFGGSQGEIESWRELLRDPDPKIRLAAHKFLTTMRDGTPRKAEPRSNSRPIQLIFGPVASDHELPRWLVDPPSGTKVLRTDGTLTDFPKFPKAAGA